MNMLETVKAGLAIDGNEDFDSELLIYIKGVIAYFSSTLNIQEFKGLLQCNSDTVWPQFELGRESLRDLTLTYMILKVKKMFIQDTNANVNSAIDSLLKEQEFQIITFLNVYELV